CVKTVLVDNQKAAYSAAIFLIPICISFDTAEKRRYATYLILNRRFSFGF
ncbi:pilus assembly protein PilC, partial [Shigella sonnei]|nr:pilus assembly protein PilC [Shigella sonnei]